MARIPQSTKTSLEQRLEARARWPRIEHLVVRFRVWFAYIDERLTGEAEVLRPCRLRYGGSASRGGFAIYRSGRDYYEEAWLPSGLPVGRPEVALDAACGLCLGDPPAWFELQTNQGNRILVA